jgi:hypothetical protein
MRSIFKTVAFCLLVSLTFTACQKDVVNNVIQYPPTADAGPNQVVQLPASVTLTGTGTSTNGNIVGYLWSLITGPNVPVIHSPSSPATNVTNLMAGTYRFQFMVIDQAGLTGVDTVSVTVNPSAIQTLSLQPANNPNEVMLGYWNGDYSDRAPTDLAGCAWTRFGDPLNTRAIFKFDLSSIPATATIISAKLSLYSNPTPLLGSNFIDANAGPANALFIGRITAAWNPVTVTWPTQPATDLATQVSIPHTNLTFLDLIDVDVKNQVTPMILSNNNHGFMLRLQSETIYNLRDFCASRHAATAKHPKLVITYQ